MKKYNNKALVALCALSLSLSACTGSFLEQDYDQGLDINHAITDPEHIGLVLNGLYYRLGYYKLYGRTLTVLPDIASDIVNHSFETTHLSSLYSYTANENDVYLGGIWSDGYKAIDGAARVILQANSLLVDATAADSAVIEVGLGQAHAIKALTTFALTNVFAQGYSDDTKDELGVVLVEEPIGEQQQVERATLEETYQYILDELATAEAYLVNHKMTSSFTMNLAAVYALNARVYLYMHDYEQAKVFAQKAITAKNSTLTYEVKAYALMYDQFEASPEDLYVVVKSAADNLSANSINTLYTDYGVSFKEELVDSLYGEQDIRLPLHQRVAGKYNKPTTNIPVIRLPEMYLILAESELALGNVSAAQEALLVVAKRNLAIQAVADLPSDAVALAAFIAQERVRELVQEGHRLFDARRTGVTIQVASGSAELKEGGYLFPIPASEINTGKGVVQNENWTDFLPTEF